MRNQLKQLEMTHYSIGSYCCYLWDVCLAQTMSVTDQHTAWQYHNEMLMMISL